MINIQISIVNNFQSKIELNNTDITSQLSNTGEILNVIAPLTIPCLKHAFKAFLFFHKSQWGISTSISLYCFSPISQVKYCDSWQGEESVGYNIWTTERSLHNIKFEFKFENDALRQTNFISFPFFQF